MAKGLASVKTLTAKEIAKKWKLPLAVVSKKIAAGVKVEKEHTKSTKEANEIARDHLGERPDYYEKLHKMEKTKVVKEESATGAVRGLGYVSGDPGVSAVDQYVNTNALAYDPFNGAKLDFMKRIHNKLHSKLGFNEYDPTNTKSSNRALAEAKLNELGEYDNKGGSTGYEGISGPIRAIRKNEMKEDVDKKTVNEMSASSFANVRPSSNIIDRRPGLSPQGIRNTIDTFKQNMAMRQSGTLRQPEVGGANIPKQTPAQAAIGAARDAVRGMGQNVRDKLGLDLDKGPSTVARNVARTVAPASTAIAGAVADRMSANKPSVNLSKLPASKASPASIPTVGGASPPSLEGGATRQVRQSPTTRNSPAAPTTPQNATREGGIDIDALERDITSKTPSDSDVKFDQQIKKGRINEISAELVGKVSNARFFRGEAPSKTLTRAINKKFIESGKKDKGKINKDKKEVKEETTMDNKELINEALDCILDNNLSEMKENLMLALQEKAVEKLEERKKQIASNYFAE